MVYTDSFDLLLDAFKAIVRGMNKAILAINNKAYGEQHRILTNCTSLLHELANALPQTQDMESFRTSLATIFAYAIKTITNANRDDDIQALQKVAALFEELYTKTEQMKTLPEYATIKQQYEEMHAIHNRQERYAVHDADITNSEYLLQQLSALQNLNDRKLHDLAMNTEKKE